VAFPESVFPDTVRIRRILKGCKSVSVSKRLKPVLEKLEENSAFVQRHRANVGFSPKDAIAVAAWEDELRTKGDSPLARYYRVMEAAEENRKKMQESTQHVEGDEYERKSKRSADNLDDDDDDEEEDEPAHKQKKGKKGKRVEPEPAVVNDDGVLEDDEEDAEDSVRDFMLDDFAWDSD
jgi:nucleolar complex protein 2